MKKSNSLILKLCVITPPGSFWSGGNTWCYCGVGSLNSGDSVSGGGAAPRSGHWLRAFHVPGTAPSPSYRPGTLSPRGLVPLRSHCSAFCAPGTLILPTESILQTRGLRPRRLRLSLVPQLRGWSRIPDEEAAPVQSVLENEGMVRAAWAQVGSTRTTGRSLKTDSGLGGAQSVMVTGGHLSCPLERERPGLEPRLSSFLSHVAACSSPPLLHLAVGGPWIKGSPSPWSFLSPCVLAGRRAWGLWLP